LRGRVNPALSVLRVRRTVPMLPVLPVFVLNLTRPFRCTVPVESL